MTPMLVLAQLAQRKPRTEWKLSIGRGQCSGPWPQPDLSYSNLSEFWPKGQPEQRVAE